MVVEPVAYTPSRKRGSPGLDPSSPGFHLRPRLSRLCTRALLDAHHVAEVVVAAALEPGDEAGGPMEAPIGRDHGANARGQRPTRRPKVPLVLSGSGSCSGSDRPDRRRVAKAAAAPAPSSPRRRSSRPASASVRPKARRCRTSSGRWPGPRKAGGARSSDGVGHQGHLCTSREHPPARCVGKAPGPLYAVKQLVLGGGDAPLFGGGGIGRAGSERRRVRFFEDGAHEKGEVGLLGGSEEGHRGIDRGLHAVVPWHFG